LDGSERNQPVDQSARGAQRETGVQRAQDRPGWVAEVLPFTMSPLLLRAESFLVQERLDYSAYESASMLRAVSATRGDS
jgi:hypothetical protein